MKTRAALAATVALLPSCALLSTFARTDSNSDGRITREEAATSEDLNAVFGSADSDRSGYLDRTEFGIAEQLIAGWKDGHADSVSSTERGDAHGH